MLYLRKMQFSEEELNRLRDEYGGYLWAAIDIHRGIITAGDEYLADLRDFLLMKRSKPEDILCAGVNLETGEIFYPTLINRRNPYVNRDGVPDVFRERVNTLMRYFFESIPNYRAERERPRYSRKPTALSFD